MENQEIVEGIKRIKEKKNAIIISHFYTRREVQDVSYFVVDSLSLCKQQ